MKHMRKALSLLLVLAMVVCFAVPAFADGTATEAKVTVYVTRDQFSEGGLNKKQAYEGGDPATITDGLVFKDSFTISDVDTTTLNNCRAKYAPDVDLPSTMNVLDAIAYVLMKNNYNFSGGWDTWNVPNGGYISSVDGFVGNPDVGSDNVDGVDYTVYYGSGWNIAFGTASNSLTPPEYYGTYYDLEPGMIIVFDFSAYKLYYPAG